MLIDTRVLLLVAALLGALLAAIVMSLARGTQTPAAGLRTWAAGGLCLAAGALAQAGRGWWPDTLGVALALPLMLAGYACQALALQQFEARQPQGRLLALVALAASVLIQYAAWLQPDYSVRALAFSGGALVLTAHALVTVARGRPRSLVRVLLLASLAALALSHAGRLAELLTRPLPAGTGSQPLNRPGFIAFFSINMMLQTATAVAFILLITERLQRQLREAAHRDPVSGALARGALLDLAARHLRQAAQDDTPTAVILIDIDHFKRLNALQGHRAGDELLRQVAAQARQCLRACDLFGRYGSDTFVAVLPATDLLAAAGTAERLRQAFARHAAQTAAASVEPRAAATVSAGVAACRGPAHGLHALLDEAHQALLNAKQAGRNRTRVSDTATAPQKLSLRVLQSRR